MNLELELKRFDKSHNDKATIGRLFVNGIYECYILEDKVREVLGQSVEQWKIKAQTAIPIGRYHVIIDKSERFSLHGSQKLGHPVDVLSPHLLEVRGYSGIRIHPGTTDIDTEGCLLPGQMHALGEDRISNSRLAYRHLLPEIGNIVGLRCIPPHDPNGAIYEWKYEKIAVEGECWITITNEFIVWSGGAEVG